MGEMVVPPPAASADAGDAASAEQEIPPQGSAAMSRVVSADAGDGADAAAFPAGDGDEAAEIPVKDKSEDGEDEGQAEGEDKAMEHTEGAEGASSSHEGEREAIFPPPPGSPVPPVDPTLAARSASRDTAETGDDYTAEGDTISALQMTHNKEMEEAYNQQSGYKNENFDDLTAAEEEEEELILPEERVRHVILPLYTVPGPLPDGEKGGSWETSEENTFFSAGLQHLHGYIEYEYERKPDLDSLNIFIQPRREHLYGQSVNIREPEKSGEFEKAIYLCDMFVRPGGGACILSESFDMNSLAGSQAFVPSPGSLYTEYTRRREFHHLVVRSYVAEVDLVELVTALYWRSKPNGRIALSIPTYASIECDLSTSW